MVLRVLVFFSFCLDVWHIPFFSKMKWVIVELSDFKGLLQYKKFCDFMILCSFAQFLSGELLFSLEAKADVLYSGVPC